MKLRNKKTGEIGHAIFINEDEEGSAHTIRMRFSGIYYIFNTLEEMNNVFEDYHPDEPLIKDEKIRKLVRDWAEINDIKTVLVCESFNSWGFKNKNDCKSSNKEYMGADLLFRGERPEELEFGKDYTIAELCGEEKE